MRARGDYQSVLISDPTRQERHELDEDSWFWNESAKEEELAELKEEEEVELHKKPPAPSIIRGATTQKKDVA
jgi:hypothetical protein